MKPIIVSLTLRVWLKRLLQDRTGTFLLLNPTTLEVCGGALLGDEVTTGWVVGDEYQWPHAAITSGPVPVMREVDPLLYQAVVVLADQAARSCAELEQANTILEVVTADRDHLRYAVTNPLASKEGSTDARLDSLDRF